MTISCESNKISERSGYAWSAISPRRSRISTSPGDHRHFTMRMPALNEDTTLLFELHDADGIRTRDPVRLVLAARADDVPVVAMRLRGISTAITPQARLPVVGDARDDYGLSRLWFEYQFTWDRARQAPDNGRQVRNHRRKRSRLRPTKSHSAEQPLQPRPLAATAGRKRRSTIESSDDESLDLKRLADMSELLRRRGVKTPDDLSKITDAGRTKADRRRQNAGADRSALTLHAEVADRLFVTLKAADNCALPPASMWGRGKNISWISFRRSNCFRCSKGAN